jgi:hypothetical protein
VKMYPANLPHMIYILRNSTQELRQERTAGDWHRSQPDPASGSTPGRMWQFAMRFQNAVGNVLTSHIIQSLSNRFRQTRNALPGDVQTACLLK